MIRLHSFLRFTVVIRCGRVVRVRGFLVPEYRKVDGLALPPSRTDVPCESFESRMVGVDCAVWEVEGFGDRVDGWRYLDGNNNNNTYYWRGEKVRFLYMFRLYLPRFFNSI